LIVATDSLSFNGKDLHHDQQCFAVSEISQRVHSHDPAGKVQSKRCGERKRPGDRSIGAHGRIAIKRRIVTSHSRQIGWRDG
jgi:hypothetical protein